MATTDLTASRLRELLRYDPHTGVFVWLVGRRGFAGAAKAGRSAGTAHASGYVRIGIDGREYLAHRLAWFYVFGFWPREQIDHVNGDRSDNRLDNLREVSNQTNCENRRSSIKPGKLLGVTFNKANRNWIAQIKASSGHIHLGCFETQELAHAAYITAKRRLHAGCTI
jgi:hypothetical protein